MCSSRFFVRLIAIVTFVLVMLPPARALTFKNPPLIPTSTDVSGLATADVNSDGKPDLLYVDGVASGQRALHVLLGKGNGTFIHGQDINLPPSVCCSLTIADVTNDGKLDVVLAGSKGFTVTVAVLVGNGDGTFQAPLLTTFQPSIDLNPGFRSPFAVGDINGDGKTDLALLDSMNGYIYLFLGDGTGNFTPATPILSNTRDAVFLHDLNGDGHLDILTTDSMGALFEVFLGKGDGTFPSFTRYTVGTAAGEFFFVDLNGDGHPDVLTTYSPGLLGYFPGNPDGTFGPLISLGPVPSPGSLVGAGDLNADGIPDLTFETPSGIAISLGKSGLAFAPPLTTISGAPTGPPLVIGDFYSDGHADLAEAVRGGIVLLIGNGDGTFASVDFYEMGHQVGGAAVAKFSGSGFEDIAVTLPATFPRLLLGDGTGKFTLGPDPNTTYGTQDPFPTILAADFNGDSKPDLNLGNMKANGSYAGSAQFVAINQGGGVFSTPISIPNSSPIMADFNGDGRMDIINPFDLQVYVSLGQADGTFQQVTTLLRLNFNNGHFNVGDVNKDGKPDLILNYYDHLEVWFGNGDGTFSYANSVDVQGIGSTGVALIADLDGDGNADIVMAPDAVDGGDSSLAILYGNGDGTFQSPVFIPIAHNYSQVTAVDLNRDNLPDLVMTDGASVAVMMNLGGRKFDGEVDYIAGPSVSALSVVDVNSDGYPDIVVANTGGTTVTVLLNEPNGTPPEGPSVSGILSVTPEPSLEGQPFTVTLSVSGQSTGAPLPTGSVDFSVDGAFVAEVALTNATGSYTYTASLIPILHTITATYSGDSNYGSRSFAVAHFVQPPTYATQTTLSVSSSALLASQTVRLSAKVTSSVSIPSGVITFLDGSSTLGSATINSGGVVDFDTALLAPGVHSLSATFQGYTQYGFNYTTPYVSALFSPSTSAFSSVTVTADPTAVSLAASATSATAGTVLSFIAHVTSNAGGPFGGVSFYDGSLLLGTMSLESGDSTSFSTASLAVGSHAITATFNANGPYATSASSPLTITVTSAPAAALTSLVAMTRQIDVSTGDSYLVATVSSANPPARGDVVFLDSGIILGTAPVDASGMARLLVAQMNSGPHALTASFAGASQYAPSVSPVLTELWPSTGPGFSLALTTSQALVAPPAVASLQVTLGPLGDFRQAVELSCANGLPVGYRCAFSPETLGGSGNASLLILPTLKIVRLQLFGNGWPGITAAFVFLLILGSGTHRQSRLLLVLFAVSLITALSGCRSSTSSLETQQTVVLTVQASAASGSQAIIHSAQIPLRLRASN
jgi:hypothetical protein